MAAPAKPARPLSRRRKRRLGNEKAPSRARVEPQERSAASERTRRLGGGRTQSSSNHACHLFGFPGVSAFAGHQLGSPAQRNHAVPKHTVTLLPGETAHTVVQITDVSNFSRSQCAPVTAFGLKVIPPDERTSLGVPFGFRACSKAGPIYLTVQP